MFHSLAGTTTKASTNANDVKVNEWLYSD